MQTASQALSRRIEEAARSYCRRMYQNLATRYRGSEKNLWIEFTTLAVQHKALNLGQGFPDYNAMPSHVRRSLADVVLGDNPMLNQYTRGFGHLRLVRALSDLYSPLFGRQLDPLTEVSVFVGAYEALYCVINALVNPGDEVIIVEPFFDSYDPVVRVAGGKPVFIPLRPSRTQGTTSSADWKLDAAELRSKFNKNTKAIIINTPNNPLGKVFTRDELKLVADLCCEFNVICIADEVYEWLVYPGSEHVRIATLPGMWERTLTIGSAGKTFSVTGWKLGWCFGPPSIVDCLRVVHQNCIYTCPTPIQEAVAAGLETERGRMGGADSYWRSLCAELAPKRDRMVQICEAHGLAPVVPEGGYFLLADTSAIAARSGGAFRDDSADPKDFQLVRWLCREKKLALIPPTAFYGPDDKGMAENMVRFCFFKTDQTLNGADAILKQFD